jgi:MoaA/NifB/PqqE/SkfB family radical SAM enzyme
VVSIETHTVCNQACVFCPVSIAPREAQSMDDALFARIVHQLASFRDTIEAIFLSSYNEPTLDPRLVEHCELLMRTGLPVALNTNATGLTPARVDRLAALGVLRLLSVNLSTLDRDRYKSDRGHDHLDLVLRNLDYAAQRLVATDMVIAVLGDEDDAHARTVDAVRNRFAGTRFQVRGHAVMDRAGRLPIGLKPEPAPDGRGPQRLAGCENLGSRPLQHLHITPAGRCVFCCEDYDERYIVGDLETMTLRQVLESDAMAQLRRWSYGLDEAPDDFICRKCIFALRR